MKNRKLINIVLSAMFLGLGLVLPLLTGQIQQVGNMLLPMHIPVFLCGLICSWQYGFIIGAILPILRSLLFTMPILYPTAIAMSFELATYGLVVGLMFSKARWQCVRSLFRSMIVAMISGRIVWAVAQMCLLGIGTDGFTLQMFVSGAFLNAIPGIILQFILIPSIMLVLDRTHLVPMKKHNKLGDKANAK